MSAISILAGRRNRVDEPLRPVTELADRVFGSGAVVDEERDHQRIGGALDPQHLAHDAVLPHLEILDGHVLDWFPLLVEDRDDDRTIDRGEASACRFRGR